MYEYVCLYESNNPNSRTPINKGGTISFLTAKAGSLTLLQCPQRSRRIAEAATRLTLGQPEGVPVTLPCRPAGTVAGRRSTRGVLTYGLGPEAAGGYRLKVFSSLEPYPVHNLLPENPVEILAL